MAVWQYMLIIGGGLLLVGAACLLPGRFFRVFGALAANMGMGLALLFVLNIIGGDPLLPLNGLTLAVSGLLGAPGVGALAALAFI